MCFAASVGPKLRFHRVQYTSPMIPLGSLIISDPLPIGIVLPPLNVCREPGKWQVYDIFRRDDLTLVFLHVLFVVPALAGIDPAEFRLKPVLRR